MGPRRCWLGVGFRADRARRSSLQVSGLLGRRARCGKAGGRFGFRAAWARGGASLLFLLNLAVPAVSSVSSVVRSAAARAPPPLLPLPRRLAVASSTARVAAAAVAHASLGVSEPFASLPPPSSTSILSPQSTMKPERTVPKLVISWPSLQTSGFGRRFGSRMRSGQSPASNIAKLQTSFDPHDTLRALRAHRWSPYDAQYLVLAILGIFSLSVIEEPGALAKTFVAALLMTSLLLPVTRQFVLPALPVFSWLTLFFSCRCVQQVWQCSTHS